MLLYIHFTLSLRILSFETFLVIGAENAVGCKFSVTNVDPSSFPRRDSKHNSISTVHGNFHKYPDYHGVSPFPGSIVCYEGYFFSEWHEMGGGGGGGGAGLKGGHCTCRV